MSFLVQVNANDVLHVTLSTPRSPVTVLRHDDVLELLRVLSQINPTKTRAIVFRSSNPQSFLNGIERLRIQRAQTSNSPKAEIDDFCRLFRLLHDVPIPTFAIVSGTCFGCGVEFALNFDYRIVSNTFDCLFYMSQVSGTMGGATFGGTWLLPRLVGLEMAVNILLWGKAVHGTAAGEIGLADLVLSQDKLMNGATHFVNSITAGSKPCAKRLLEPFKQEADVIERVVSGAQRQIDDLPPSYQPIYLDWLQLLVEGAIAVDYENHLEEATRTAIKHASSQVTKNAMAFFFVRQTSNELVGSVPTQEVSQYNVSFLSTANDPGCFLSFINDLRRHIIIGLKWSLPSCAESIFISLSNSDQNSALSERFIAVIASLQVKSEQVIYPCIYAPTVRTSASKRLAELALPQAQEPRMFRRLARWLARLGFEVVFSQGEQEFLINRLLFAYISILVRYILLGGSASEIDYAFRNYGFIRRPKEIVRDLGAENLISWLSMHDLFGTVPREEIALAVELLQTNSESVVEEGEEIVYAVLLSLLAEIRASLSDKTLRHVAVADVVARELLDFPVEHLSLCYHLTTPRVAHMLNYLEQSSNAFIASSLTNSIWASSQAFVSQSKPFYR